MRSAVIAQHVGLEDLEHGFQEARVNDFSLLKCVRGQTSPLVEQLDDLKYVWQHQLLECLVIGEPCKLLHQLKDIFGQHGVLLVLSEQLQNRGEHLSLQILGNLLIDLDEVTEHIDGDVNCFLIAGREHRHNLLGDCMDNLLPLLRVDFLYLDFLHILINGFESLISKNELFSCNEKVRHSHEYLLLPQVAVF